MKSTGWIILLSLTVIFIISSIALTNVYEETFRGKAYTSGSECEAMVLNFLTAHKYDYMHTVPSLMRFNADMCNNDIGFNPSEKPFWMTDSFFNFVYQRDTR